MSRDVWNANATGVYSGLVADGNGNENDTSNYDTTFLRGISKADSDGVVTFETIFPGHYSGRTNHVVRITPGVRASRIVANISRST